MRVYNTALTSMTQTPCLDCLQSVCRGFPSQLEVSFPYIIPYTVSNVDSHVNISTVDLEQKQQTSSLSLVHMYRFEFKDLSLLYIY